MQVEAGHIELVLIQQRFRQPDGLGLVPSSSTIEDIKIHRFYLKLVINIEHAIGTLVEHAMMAARRSGQG